MVRIGNRAFGSNAERIAPRPPAIYGTPPVAQPYLGAREGRASPRGARERSRTSKSIADGTKITIFLRGAGDGLALGLSASPSR